MVTPTNPTQAHAQHRDQNPWSRRQAICTFILSVQRTALDLNGLCQYGELASSSEAAAKHCEEIINKRFFEIYGVEPPWQTK